MNDSPVPILVAEDNPADVELFTIACEEDGLAVACTVARDGGEAIALLKRPDVRPRLILLDINMPRVNGFEALDFIRTRPELAAIPVVMLTTSPSPRDQERCRNAGVARYLVKPARFQEFVAMVHGLRSLLGLPV